MKLICPPDATPEEVGATLILCHICHPGADALQNQSTLMSLDDFINAAYSFFSYLSVRFEYSCYSQ